MLETYITDWSQTLKISGLYCVHHVEQATQCCSVQALKMTYYDIKQSRCSFP